MTVLNKEKITQKSTSGFPNVRMRRLRQHPKLRDLVRETNLTVNDLVLPLFIKVGRDIKSPIDTLPGHFQFSIDQLKSEIKTITDLNIPAVLLFGIPEAKDEHGAVALNANGIIQQAIQEIKSITPDLLVISDLCFCEYTKHGHCGVVTKNYRDELDVENDATLQMLNEQAISHAQAGADIIAPSGMMDGVVQAIRSGLDQAGFSQVAILSYAVKYASSFYGPFRSAAEYALQFGDRSTYQMDPANAERAFREAQLDVQEGADMLMVKPAHTYLDIIFRIKQKFPSVPLGAYHVSGEYAMLKAAAEKGWLDENKVMLESLLSIKRAGADFIITYFAKDAARLL